MNTIGVIRNCGWSVALTLALASYAVAGDGGPGASRNRGRSLSRQLVDSPPQTEVQTMRSNIARRQKPLRSGQERVAATVAPDSKPTGGSQLLVPPPNDTCVGQTPIQGPGVFSFPDLNTAVVNESPTSHPSCELFGTAPIVNDVWYCWTAPPATGLYEVATCGLTATTADDTYIAVYDGCGCPPTGPTRLVVCNDDICGPSSLPVQSRLTFRAQGGQQYLIRIGNPSFPPIPTAGQFSVTEVFPPCASQTPALCQEPDTFAARGSNRTARTAADNFTPLADGSVTEVCWWGIYADNVGDCQGFAPDTFVIRYYEDAGGKPGALIDIGGAPAEFKQAGGTPTLTVAGPVATGRLVTGSLPEYEFTATHAPVPVTAGGCYWIEISNSVSTSCGWLWSVALPPGPNAGDDIAIWDRDGVDPPVYDITETVDIDQSFCLDVDLGDAAQQCGLAAPTPCAASTNDCCADAGAGVELGCVDSSCCAAVCSGDIFCCAIAWDQFCADTAAKICNGICDPCPSGPVNWVSPQNGFLDATEPRRIDSGTTLEGTRIIMVDAPPNADPTCWTLCEGAPEPGQLANDIISVSADGSGSYALLLRHRITPGVETKINYSSTNGLTNATAVFTSHPADSDADGISDRTDIVSLIDCCLNGPCVPPFSNRRCDMNRSNTTTAEDLLRLIDLLNGGGSFQQWENEAVIPQGPCP